MRIWAKKLRDGTELSDEDLHDLLEDVTVPIRTPPSLEDCEQLVELTEEEKVRLECLHPASPTLH